MDHEGSSLDHADGHSTPRWLSAIASVGRPALGEDCLSQNCFIESAFPFFDDDDDFKSKVVQTTTTFPEKGDTAQLCLTTFPAKTISLHFPKSFENKCATTLDESLIHDLKNQTKKDFVFPFLEQNRSNRNWKPDQELCSTSLGNHCSEDHHTGPITSLLKNLGTTRKVPEKNMGTSRKVPGDILGTSLPRSFGSPFLLSATENGDNFTEAEKWTGVLEDQDSPVFGTFPSSAKLSSEDLIKIKNEILFAKTKSANLESEFSVEKSLVNMNKTKREILASHGHDIYLQNHTAINNQTSDDPEIFEMESEKTNVSDGGDSDHPETENPIEKFTGFVFAQPFVQNWFFRKQESGSGSESLSAEDENVESVARSCPPDSGCSGFSDFLTRSRTFPQKLADLNVWAPTDL